MKRIVSAQIAMTGSARRIWSILVDFKAYARWNPFIVNAQGQPRVGERLKLKARMPGGVLMPLRPVVVEVICARRLEWVGHFVRPGWLDGRHHFQLDGLPDGRVHLVQQEVFSGHLLPILGPYLGKGAFEGFNAMNYALKRRIEAANSQAASRSPSTAPGNLA